MTERTLDRKVRFDPASRSFPITAVVGSDTPFIDQVWECNTWNDQGTEGACVGFGWSHELAATPEVVPTSEEVARAIYHRAQMLDIWAGEDYEGTSVLGGVKAVREIKNNVGEPYIKEYRWAFGIEDLLRALAYQGPVVLGLNWYTGMFNTDRAGWLRVTGYLAGGHCILGLGVVVVAAPGFEGQALTSLSMIDLDKSYIVLHNSWGKDWGINGRAKMSVRDMHRLLGEQGEACVPMVRVSDYVAPPPVVEEPSAPAPVEPEVVPVTPIEPVPGGMSYFSTRRSSIFHDSHVGLKPFRTFDTRETAIAAGFRPCKTCKP